MQVDLSLRDLFISTNIVYYLLSLYYLCNLLNFQNLGKTEFMSEIRKTPLQDFSQSVLVSTSLAPQ